MSLEEAPPKALAALLRRDRFRAIEAVPWLGALAAFLALPSYLALGSQILIMVLFALSLDLALGYAGIVTLGHAAFFGTGSYVAGILAARGWGEPISGLLLAGIAAGALGLATGAIVLRTRGLSLLMLTLVVAEMVQEAANKLGWLTGGADGLQGIAVDPLLGLFRFDLFGRTAYLYALAVLFLAWALVRRLVHSPFGRSLTGLRENETRMRAIGAPVFQRRLRIYVVSSVLAGVAGALLAQTTQFVGLQVLGFELSGSVLIMLVLGGVGRLYGAFIGAPLYMIAQDQLARRDPVNWLFWVGLLLVLVVFFARGGVFGLLDRVRGGAAER
ncbi:MAG: branched-chain amino acid ABC transporter permease [Alphaproteobacteria bacterium]|nr:branched-chain amino acid ABC transporter permease [Alphaproteobacteria bacterium]